MNPLRARALFLALPLALSLALLLVCGAFAPLYAAFGRETSQPMPELFKAIDKGDLARVRAAIDGGADVNAVYDRDTMLCWAIREKNMEAAKLLLQSPRLDVNKRGILYDSFGSIWERTPLIQAAHMGQAEIVALLLQRGANPNARDRTDSVPEARGNTALIKAAQRDHTEVIRVLVTQARGILIDAQTTEGETPLSLVVAAEDLEAVKMLHTHGAKINHQNNIGASMLVGTVLHKKFEVLEYLVANGADINMSDNNGQSPLMQAIMVNNKELKKIGTWLVKFITYKPKLDFEQLKGEGGYSAMHLAARFGFVDIGKLLLDSGATLDITSLLTGGTPLHTAASAHQIDFAKMLIKRKANLEIVDKLGSTPLLTAALVIDPDMVEVLVDAGANVNVKSTVNPLVTPMVHAAGNPNPLEHRKNVSIIKYLLDHKGDINFPSSNGTTPLMAAARKSDTSDGYDRASLLIDRGARLDAVNDKGETALMLAAGAGNEKLVKLLLDKGADAQKKNGAGETVMAYAARAGKSGSVSALEAKGVKPEAPIVRKTVVVDALVGTWKGFHDGLPQALYTVVLNKNGSFDFNSRLTPEALKNMPKGAVNPVIAAQKGKYTIEGDTMIWDLVGAPPTSMKWKLENGTLVIDNKIRLKKTK
ncbi:MAG TPA: ankyrin repeat domain-containing protein [Humidesulfovibrio sp.]|uniref:ankyrin repeat domain-containing protein n=1 Tax=Humidesulfovibrio sp. TaxID=2910988 RepID=UPI002BB7489B|nr:ankyrin repeat domain-containing protein [Humidesulfovibrio sp.]HWR02398.1 ankyrin repeat domain-containing protein [Humidesulfovibrio sp.]